MSGAVEDRAPAAGPPAAGPVLVETLDGGALRRMTIAGGRGNVITTAVARALDAALAEAEGEPGLRAVVLCGQGQHFSFGASVEEHLPDRVAAMLSAFHGLLRRLLAFPVPVVAAIRGQCLGGGLELALACTRMIAAPDARLGQPEVRLAVFAPAASVLLPPRIGQAAADEMLVTGRAVPAGEALLMHLVDEIAEDPASRAERWAHEHLVALSPAALRRALRASRALAAAGLARGIDELERLYLAEALPAEDAREGLTAFLEKRAPRYEHA